MMRKEYKILITIFIAEIVCIAALSEVLITMDYSKIVETVVALLFWTPLIRLFYLVSKDDEISLKKRTLAKIALGFFVLCWLGGLAAEIIKFVLGMNL